MKKLIIFICAMMLLTSCGKEYPTNSEIEAQKKLCKLNGKEIHIRNDYDMGCRSKPTPVMDCIEEYTNWLDEKYNNPDHITNLREDNYSQVVKTCNEVFGEKDNLKTNK